MLWCSAKDMPFYKELHSILGGDPISTVNSPGDTLVGLEAAASRLSLDNQVAHGEVELEDNMEHMARFLLRGPTLCLLMLIGGLSWT